MNSPVENSQEVAAGHAVKRPVGIMPKEIWIEKRVTELFGAIDRYSEAGLPIPRAWSTEAWEWTCSLMFQARANPVKPQPVESEK